MQGAEVKIVTAKGGEVDIVPGSCLGFYFKPPTRVAAEYRPCVEVK
jgi:hypothetical protein